MLKRGGLEELEQFQEYLSDYKIVVFNGLNPDRFMLSGNSFSAKKLYLLYDMESGRYNVINNLEAAMAKRYTCNACDTLYDSTLKCVPEIKTGIIWLPILGSK